MLIEHAGTRPTIHSSARVAPNATVCGDVTIGENTSVGFGAVLVAESGPIVIGEHCVIMDTAVIRGVRNNAVRIGNHVLVGPRAYLTGCTIEDEAFLATGATIFNGARVGRRAEVRINGIVHLRTSLPDDSTVPINWIAVGNPAQILPPDKHDDIWALQKPLDFPKYVFGVDRPPPGRSILPDVLPRYARALIRRHAADKDVTGH